MDLRAVVRLGEGLLAEHGLSGWHLALDHAKRRAGACRFESRTISVSRHLMALYDEEQVRDTLLHEIAHALVGPRHGHDAAWRSTALAIGCSGSRLVSPDAPRAPAPWRGTCARGHTYDRHRRPTRPTSCSRCDPRFNVDHLLRWTFHGREVALGARYERELRELVLGRDRRLAVPSTAGPRATPAPPEEWSDVAAFVEAEPATDAPAWWREGQPPGLDDPWLLDDAGRRWEVEDPPFEIAEPPARPRSRLELVAAVGGLTPGWRVRVAAAGKYLGREGVVVKSARTRYHVRAGGDLLTVPFALVDPVAAPRA